MNNIVSLAWFPMFSLCGIRKHFSLMFNKSEMEVTMYFLLQFQTMIKK